MPTPTPCAAYVRVSSKSQDLAMQKHAIEEEAARRGDTIVSWYSEKRSAKTSKRPELERLRADIRASRVRKVYGFRFDRFLRTGPADAYAFARDCHDGGAELVTVADGLHLKPGTEDVTTTVLLFAFSLAAQLERAAVNDRISAARERIESENGTWGRPSRFTAAERLRIVDMARTMSHREIAMQLGLPKATVTYVLKQAKAAKPAAA
ncbi:recombinase family protein [Anaeromyxobacter terrae]|uniref:recombinase family protein n=1 Tax=Anaeromyxobacter terrae TaxID=2925406 RepID=UPI001F57AB49|nr:recombinase family protein [Anaeromyxobacter sp. SG22]